MTDWPTIWDDLPRDLKRKLPIPFIAQREDGSFDFTTINSDNSLKCFEQRLCAVCGQPRGWWSAFVGGSLSIASGNYQTPPMHPVCADAAMQICPYIVFPNAKRASPRHASGEVGPNQDPSHPDKWFMGICRTNDIKAALVPLNGKDPKGGVALMYQAGKWRTIREFVYIDKFLTEVI